MDISSLISPIGEFIKSLWGHFRSKPFFEVTLENTNIQKSSVLTMGIWIKNLSSLPHNITKIEGEQEDFPNGFKIEIADKKFRPPITLRPDDPEKLIQFVGQFTYGDPKSSCNIIIKVFSRWKGKEVEAGRVRFSLK